MNGYFQLIEKYNGIYLKVMPPEERGLPVNIKEILDYLAVWKFDQYQQKELNAAVDNVARVSEVYVAPKAEIAIDETMMCSVSLDKMKVKCRFYPPSEKGRLLTENEIYTILKSKQITFGINQDEIKRFINNREYCTDYFFAEGKMPDLGRDAKIEYFFNTNLNLKPKKNEDGSVNYKEVNTISHCKQGDLLARLTPEVEGSHGRDVYGGDIQPRKVRKLVLEYSNNISTNSDKTEIYSDVTGHVSLVNGKVFVSAVYEVSGDVDNSIGNIDYSGNVHVAGNVRGGFVIRANGNIEVDGVVEDATLIAGGQILVRGGIRGQGKGEMKADGNIICQYIENAHVYSGGYIETDCILHSQVSAFSEIRACGKKGFIAGGITRAGAYIEAQSIGSAMGVDTRVEVGINPEKKERMLELKEQMKACTEEIERLKVILATYTQKLQSGEKLPPEKMSYVQKLAYTCQAKNSEIEPLKAEHSQLQQEMLMSNGARISARKTVYEGVTVVISDMEMRVKDEYSFCQFTKRDGEIVRGTL